MANKLAGQRAKFSRARSIYFTASDDAAKHRAVELMAEVVAGAASLGFAEEMVTQGEDVPGVVQEHLRRSGATPVDLSNDEDAERFVEELRTAVDVRDALEVGTGAESVYAYGYCCAPDRLKIGSTTGDVVARIAAQIGTGTPDKPRLLLKIATPDCRALERALHGALRVRGKQVEGAGSEWFLVGRDDVLALHRAIIGDSPG